MAFGASVSSSALSNPEKVLIARAAISERCSRKLSCKPANTSNPSAPAVVHDVPVTTAAAISSPRLARALYVNIAYTP